MKKLFDLAAERHDEIKKEAFAPLAAGIGRGIYTIGKTMIKNPFKTLSATMAAGELASGATSGARAAAKGKNVGTFISGPTI